MPVPYSCSPSWQLQWKRSGSLHLTNSSCTHRTMRIWEGLAKLLPSRKSSNNSSHAFRKLHISSCLEFHVQTTFKFPGQFHVASCHLNCPHAQPTFYQSLRSLMFSAETVAATAAITSDSFPLFFWHHMYYLHHTDILSPPTGEETTTYRKYLDKSTCLCYAS